jgi:NAD(P)-dependent dehydrogenase (short-subunit alcohol dehydrogenase family)
MGRLDGKVAVITGASSGMGAASARLFAAEGAAVVIADIDVDGGEAVAAQCRDDGHRVVFQRTDVTREDDVAGAVQRAVSEFGALHVMFNNAGAGGALGLEDLAVEAWDASYALLLRSVFFGIKHATPELRRAGGGSIITTSSDAGVRPLAGNHAYATFKAGALMLTQSAALTLGADRIRVNAITPGWIVTPLLADTFGGEEALRPVATHAQPIPRCGEGTDIAEAALFLASDASSFITGVTLPVDGGWLVQSFQSPQVDAAIAALGGEPDWM